MGLELSISLDKEIREIDSFFNDLKFKAVTLAARQALNRTALRTRVIANRAIRQQRNLKLKDLKGRVTIKKATGTNIAALEARINFSGIPLPLILFLVGQKTPKAQAVANPKRKARSFQIIKGQKKKKRGLFVEKAKRGKEPFQVFRRKDPSVISKGFKSQSAPSIANLLRTKSNMLRKIENNALSILQQEYDGALARQLKKLKL